MSADLYFTGILLFFCHVPSELAERNSTKIGHIVGIIIIQHFYSAYKVRGYRDTGSMCNLKTHVQSLGYPLSLQIGSPITTLFDDFAT